MSGWLRNSHIKIDDLCVGTETESQLEEAGTWLRPACILLFLKTVSERASVPQSVRDVEDNGKLQRSLMVGQTAPNSLISSNSADAGWNNEVETKAGCVYHYGGKHSKDYDCNVRKKGRWETGSRKWLKTYERAVKRSRSEQIWKNTLLMS